MPGINQATVGDDYTAAATVQDVFTSTGGWFSVASHPVIVQLQWGPNASGSRWSDEQTLGSGAFGTIPPGCTGIRFKNLVAGAAATVTAYVGAGGPPPDPRGNVWPEPALAISAIGSVTTSGTAPTQTVVTASGAGTYTLPSGCVAILVECWGAGGGGAGSPATGAGQVGLGGGGGGGGYSAQMIAAPASSYTYSVGAGGAGGGAVNGSPGGDTTFGPGPSVRAKGGGGGTVTVGPSAVPAQVGGGAGGAASGGVGTVLEDGAAGGTSWALTATQIGTGGGGGSPRGTPTAAPGITTSALNGANGTSPGGGGRGTGNTQNQGGGRTGGTGANGQIVVTEFY